MASLHNGNVSIVRTSEDRPRTGATQSPMAVRTKTMRRLRAGLILAPLALAWPTLALAQTPPTAPTAEDRQAIERQLEEIRAMKAEMATRMGELDARVDALESELERTVPGIVIPAEPVTPEQAMAGPGSPVLVAAREGQPAITHDPVEEIYEPGRGIVLASGDWGEMSATLIAYARYLNQQALDEFYTDDFGRTFAIDRRQDIQFNKVNLTFKGWMVDPRFRYLIFLWTQNAAQGQGAQVVIGGYVNYKFNDALTVNAGVGALPTTRTTMYTFPNWLRVDNRTVADDYMRGSYTTGIWAEGEIYDDVFYRVMLGNNLSQLGIDAGQLDDGLNTVAAALWWYPTTGEFGTASGFGDYDWHEELATMVGINFTRSREDAQSQPDTNAIENSQIRLSDGTRLFLPNALGNGEQITQATYRMLAVNAGAKYRGWAVEGEYYTRWLDDFDATGPTPITDTFDHGFQLHASFVPIKDRLQAYASMSKVWGEFGNPSDLALGINYYPFGSRQIRFNTQALWLNESPVGYPSVPYVVGGNGWVFTADAMLTW